jgi:hypothetical protein
LNQCIWFTQNDDHPFVDIDSGIIAEGLTLLTKEPNELASIYLSHWPEALKLAGKLGKPEITGSFLSFDGTLLDSIQILKPALFEYVFVEIDWKGARYRRIDELLRQRAIWGSIGNTDLSLQKIYVPLREQCRKFMAYPHVDMHTVSPLRPTYEIEKIGRTAQEVEELVLAKHSSFWTGNNSYSLTADVVDLIKNLYGNED